MIANEPVNVERLLDQMKRAGIDVETIVHAMPLPGVFHVGCGLFLPHFKITFADGRAEAWYSRMGVAKQGQFHNMTPFRTGGSW